MTNRKPYIKVAGSENSCWEGWEEIGKSLVHRIASLNKKKVIIAIESNLGTHLESNLHAIKEVLSPNVTCLASSIYKDENQILQLLKREDGFNSFSISATNNIEDYFDPQRLEGLRNNIEFIDEGVILIHGTGASLIWEYDILIYSDISRWEQLQRFRRNEISNIAVNTRDLPYETKEKWSYFTDWRICDKIKKKIIKTCDFFIETNNWKKPKMATGEIVRKGYEQIYTQPFFNAPFFDPALWEEFNVQEDIPFDWTFNCNMDKNNVLLKLDNHLFETPAINLIYYSPAEILGQSMYRKFGLEMPFRFNFLDSLDEKDYNIYTYPGVPYLKENYGIGYDQHESFYIMDAEKGASLGLGLKQDTSIEFLEETASNVSNKRDQNTVLSALNTIHPKKHDCISVPNDQLHTKGDKLMVLRITTSPSIFELKLYEDKLDPVPSIDFNDMMDFPQANDLNIQNYINHFSTKELENGAQEDVFDTKHNDPFMIKRIWFSEPITLKTSNSIMVVNLIAGENTLVKGDFQEVTLAYAETMVIPAKINEFHLIPSGKKMGILVAQLKG